MARGIAISAICLVFSLAALLAACESQPYPPRTPQGLTPSAPATPDPAVSEAAPLPEAPPESEVFLAARQVAKRGPTRDLRNAAFRYMNLRFSSGTLSAASDDSTTQGLSAPVKVTEEARLTALDQLLEAVRGLPEAQRAAGTSCTRPYDACSATAGEAWDAPHCSGPLLMCLAEQFAAEGESG